MKDRIEWVDVAKGIGIISVIVSHCAYFGGGIHNWIFSWHMPLFFILSGLFIKPEDIKNFMIKKTKTLVIPYIVFSFIGLIITLIIPVWRNEYGLRGALYDIYMASPEYINVSSIWFLACLFITSTIFQFVLKIKNQIIEIGCIIVSATIGFVFATYRFNMEILPGKRLPWNIDVMFVALLFIAIGYYLKKQIYSFAKWIDKKNILLECVVAVIFMLLSVICSIASGRVNLHGLTFGNPVLYVAEAIVGTIMLISVAVVFCKHKNIKRLFNWLGNNSVKLLGIQAILVRLYIVIVNTIFNTDYELYYLPKNHQILSSIIVTISSCIAVWAFNIIYNKMVVHSMENRNGNIK